MSQDVKNELLPKMRQQYLNRGRKGKSKLIDTMVDVHGYSRKHAIKMLGAKTTCGGNPRVPKGRPIKYGEDVIKVLKGIWKAAEQPCGKRLVVMLPLWLPFYEKHNVKLNVELRKEVLSISAAQIDRLLKPYKAKEGFKGRCGTKPGSLLKNQIPIRTDNWDITRPGYLEADTVAHCGGSLEGDFIWSLALTDIYSGWTALRAVWNKGADGIVAAVRDIEFKLPFELLGFDCDNGSEFLNNHLLRYFQNRSSFVKFTRSRPYHKDDNGHIEQKNWTHVRQLLGYDRLEDPALIEEINNLYVKVWEPLHNYFMPSAKLITKDRHGAKLKRCHDIPQTPCDRLLASDDISKETKRLLIQRRSELDPIELGNEVEKGLRRILQLSHHSGRPTGSLRSAIIGVK